MWGWFMSIKQRSPIIFNPLLVTYLSFEITGAASKLATKARRKAIQLLGLAVPHSNQSHRVEPKPWLLRIRTSTNAWKSLTQKISQYCG
jgi:hypothetical protein